MTEGGGEFKAITCNYAVDRGMCAKGAKAYVIGGWGGGAWERLRVLARSRGGRWIRIWEDYRHLTNFRLTTVVPESADHDRILEEGSLHHILTDQQKQELCDYLNGGGWDASPYNTKSGDQA
jgi:hypothetical protein